jgi:hypothetical protein
MVRCEDRGERWWNGGPGPGQSASWAGPLSALNVGSAGSKPAGVGCNLDAPTGRLFAIGLQSFICWTCINCDAKIELWICLQCACFEGTIERADE